LHIRTEKFAQIVVGRWPSRGAATGVGGMNGVNEGEAGAGERIGGVERIGVDGGIVTFDAAAETSIVGGSAAAAIEVAVGDAATGDSTAGGVAAVGSVAGGSDSTTSGIRCR
jgi:hypothetical protein